MSDFAKLAPTNPNIPAIPNPVEDIRSLMSIAIQVKQAIDSLGGYRGSTAQRAVTFEDLILLNVITQQVFDSPSGKALVSANVAQAIAQATSLAAFTKLLNTLPTTNPGAGQPWLNGHVVTVG